MLDAIFQLYTDGGGLFLFDPILYVEDPNGFSACLKFLLYHADAIREAELYPDAVANLRRYTRRDPCIPLFTEEGTFFIHITDAAVTDGEKRVKQHEHFVEPIRVESGWLCLADVMLCFDWKAGWSQYDNFRFAVPKGDYRVHIASLQVPEDTERVIGTYGSEDHPAIHIQLEVCDDVSLPAPTDTTPFPILSFPNEPAPDSRGYRPGIICRAEVSRVESDKVSLRLWLTQNTWSGFARMPLPAHKELKPGDFVRVRLLEDRRNFWRVELAEG